ncbi:MAG TPA: hypothetical protein VKV20_15025 [Ktedonobacteraceae bacterium]|nr:hypothetical protein [Ktedonobacteraceae bacterium]
MEKMERADAASEVPERNTPRSYFMAIIAVLGGTLLMPPFSLVFTWIGAMLLVVLIAALLIYRTRREQKWSLGKILARGHATLQAQRYDIPLIGVGHRGPIYRAPGATTPRSR